MMNKMITVTALRESAATGRVRVELLIGEECPRRQVLSVLAEAAAGLPPRGEISEEAYGALCDSAAVASAVDAALRVLSAADCSRRTLVDKLRARGHAAAAAREAADLLAARGYLDETRAALRAAERDLAKMWGDRRILTHLVSQGYPDGAIEAVREHLEDEDSVARCRRLLARRLKRAPADENEKRRLVASLLRFGYSMAEIRAALK